MEPEPGAAATTASAAATSATACLVVVFAVIAKRRLTVAAIAALTISVGLAAVLGGPAGAASRAVAVVRQGSPAGPGTSASSEEVRALAAAARRDPAALERLRRVTEVDGRPVDLAAALNTADGRDLDARLAALAAGEPAAASSGTAAGESARRTAGSVLAQRKFHASEPPRPLQGVLRWIGRLFEPVVGPVGRFFTDLIPRGWRIPLLALLLAVVTAVLATYFVRRRSRTSVERHRKLAGLVEGSADPRDLERRADGAEAAGRYGEAVRLRFLAGLLRLDRAGAVQIRTSETTGQLRRNLANPDFDRLALTFDEVVYGNRPATAADVAAARAGWSRLLDRRAEPVGAAR